LRKRRIYQLRMKTFGGKIQDKIVFDFVILVLVLSASMASCIAVLSSSNAPLFVQSSAGRESGSAADLADHYSLHTSLDVIEEKTSGGALAGAAGAGKRQQHQPGLEPPNREPYLGCLYTTEKQKVFGYVTSTRIKFVVIVDVSSGSSVQLVRDNEVRQIFRRLHLAYSQLMCNPFYVPGEKIESKRFANVVAGLMASGGTPQRRLVQAS